MEFYLVSTSHLEDRLWFRDDEDFSAGMNHVAVGAAIDDVRILADSLMSNHVHFVLESTRENAERFIMGFKKRYSYYYRKKYGVKEFLRRNSVDVRELPDMEALKRAIAYVQMNPVAANICPHPSMYAWGSGACFFNQNKTGGVLLGSLSKRNQYRILHTEQNLPGEWIMCDKKFILPSSYVCTQFIESLFKTPLRYDYYLKTSGKAKKRLDADEALPSFRDQSILAAVTDLCFSMFHESSVNHLSQEQLSELTRQIKRRFSMDIAQLARVLGKTYAEISTLLVSY